jgi:hypothetical protein
LGKPASGVISTSNRRFSCCLCRTVQLLAVRPDMSKTATKSTAVVGWRQDGRGVTRQSSCRPPISRAYSCCTRAVCALAADFANPHEPEAARRSRDVGTLSAIQQLYARRTFGILMLDSLFADEYRDLFVRLGRHLTTAWWLYICRLYCVLRLYAYCTAVLLRIDLRCDLI